MSLTRVDERERQAALEEEQARLKALKVRFPPSPHPVTHHKVPEAAALWCQGGKRCARLSMWPTWPALARVN